MIVLQVGRRVGRVTATHAMMMSFGCIALWTHAPFATSRALSLCPLSHTCAPAPRCLLLPHPPPALPFPALAHLHRCCECMEGAAAATTWRAAHEPTAHTHTPPQPAPPPPLPLSLTCTPPPLHTHTHTAPPRQVMGRVEGAGYHVVTSAAAFGPEMASKGREYRATVEYFVGLRANRCGMVRWHARVGAAVRLRRRPRGGLCRAAG